MENKNWIELNDGKMNSNEYFFKLLSEFPILKAQIEDEDSEMVHNRMEVFSNYNIDQIKSKNYSELKRCFYFQESYIENLNSDLINALNVSYFESLLLGECASEMTEMIKLMPSKLTKAYKKYEEYYTKLSRTK